MFIQKRKIVAEDQINQDAQVEEPVVEVEAEATDLLFEAEDVAQLLAEATGESVEVTVEDDFVEFAVGDQVLTAEAEGNEEVLEASTKVVASKRTVTAATARRRRVATKK